MKEKLSLRLEQNIDYTKSGELDKENSTRLMHSRLDVLKKEFKKNSAIRKVILLVGE
tara:strand:- start:198 stop:368 length:171 start_codon:yes stop_codon:yes gene_type:complete